MSQRVTRRSALSLVGLAVLSLAVPPTVLTLSDAEAEEAAPKTGTKKAAPKTGTKEAAPKTGTQRRQDRRKGREKKRKDRQKKRKDQPGGEKSGEKK